MSKPHPRKTRALSRPWIVPPGLLVQGEPFEGYHVLDETRDELGVLLWQSLRDVEVWAMSPPDQRRNLFTAGALHQRMERIDAEVDPAAPVRPVLEGLASLLGRPGAMTPQEVCDLCEELSRWASDAGLPRTALAFAQRAAIAAPDEAGPAYLVGLISRRAADYRRAEVWFRRCLAIARHNQDWRVYALAHAGLGQMHMQRGDAPRARSRLLRALRAARRYGIWSVRSTALHDLFCIAATGPEPRLAEQYARAAFRSYGRQHPRLPALAHDIARFWMSQGHHSLALATFQAVLPHITRPQEQMLALSNLAQAAGGAGEGALYTWAWNEVWRMIDERDDMELVAEALINLAHGAASLGQVVRMDMAASYARTIATRRNEAQERLVAEELLQTSRDMGIGSVPEPVDPESEPVLAGSDVLAEQLVEALTEGVAER
jgi:tetratricopeptide (TPR) repeat protein